MRNMQISSGEQEEVGVGGVIRLNTEVIHKWNDCIDLCK